MVEPQELLEMRLLALAQDIAKVKEVTTHARRRRDRHKRLIDQVGQFNNESIRGPLSKAKSLIGEIVDAMQGDPDLYDALENHEWIDRLNQLPQELTTAYGRATAVGNELQSADRSMQQIDLDLDSLTTSLGKRCTELGAKVRELQQRLSDNDRPRDVWDAYEKTLDNGCQDLFADYVDFLGGLTLRDTHLDDNVCAITDALLKEIPAKVKHLAVPSRRPTLASALHGLVKLGFPEWTVWSVPLAGHETGILHARMSLGHRVIDPIARLLPANAAFQQKLFAEAYAAYTVGPAYGCSAVLLKFQPNHDTSRKAAPSDVERAAVVLGVLRQMNQSSAGFRDIVDRTEDYWHEAVGHVGDRAAVDEAAARLRPFTEAVTEQLRAEETTGFDARKWGVVDKVAEALAAGPPTGYRPPPGTDVRVLLNAAWVARLGEPMDRDLPRRIARRVEVVWRSISDRKGPRGGNYDRP